MQNHEILVNTMAADQVVKTFAKNLDSFHDNASSTAQELRSSVHGIERGWSGETYDSFRSEMERELGQLENCLARVESLSSRLHAVSAKFSLMIDALRKSGK